MNNVNYRFVSKLTVLGVELGQHFFFQQNKAITIATIKTHPTAIPTYSKFFDIWLFEISLVPSGTVVGKGSEVILARTESGDFFNNSKKWCKFKRKRT